MDNKRKALGKVFKVLGYKLDPIVPSKTVNVLGVRFNLETSSYAPYRKPNDNPMYINIHSTHPNYIKKQILKMVEDRLNKLSSNEQALNNAKMGYEEALGDSGYNVKLNYKRNAANTISMATMLTMLILRKTENVKSLGVMHRMT